jgi:hypothetical protein
MRIIASQEQVPAGIAFNALPIRRAARLWRARETGKQERLALFPDPTGTRSGSSSLLWREAARQRVTSPL